jgi:hypothetical protein
MGFTFAQADAIALDDLLVHHLAIDQLEGLAGRAGVSLDARSHASDFLSLCVTGEGEIAKSRFWQGLTVGLPCRQIKSRSLGCLRSAVEDVLSVFAWD